MKKDNRKFKKRKKTPAYFKPECTRVKIENIGLDLTISFQYNGVTSVLSSIWMREKSGIREVETLNTGMLEH